MDPRVTNNDSCAYTAVTNYLNLKKFIMKNLFKKSTIAFVVLSLFVISCEKAKVPAPPKPKMEADVSFETKAGAVSLSEAELTDGKRKAGVYVIVPILPEGLGNCNGKKEWHHHVETVPGGIDIASGIDPETGTVRLPIHEIGTYTVIITYSCNGVVLKTIKVTIVV
jgi:hypothetical protein